MSFKSYTEALKVKKMKLPNKTPGGVRIDWNDTSSHNLFDRIGRSKLSRKEAVDIIMKGIDEVYDSLNYGPYVIDFTKSGFYVTIYLQKNYTVSVKTILSHDMKLRDRDRIYTVDEMLEYFDIDLSEFYDDKHFYNGYIGNLLVEESLDRNFLEVHPDWIEIDL